MTMMMMMLMVIIIKMIYMTLGDDDDCDIDGDGGDDGHEVGGDDDVGDDDIDFRSHPRGGGRTAGDLVAPAAVALFAAVAEAKAECEVVAVLSAEVVAEAGARGELEAVVACVHAA